MNPNVFETASHMEPFNSLYLNAAMPEQQWPEISTTTVPFSSNAQQWRSQLPQQGATDDLLRAPIGLEDFAWPEINIEQVDDDLLAELLKLDTYGSDACGTTIDALTPQLKHVKISPRKSCFNDLKPSLKVTQQ